MAVIAHPPSADGMRLVGFFSFVFFSVSTGVCVCCCVSALSNSPDKMILGISGLNLSQILNITTPPTTPPPPHSSQTFHFPFLSHFFLCLGANKKRVSSRKSTSIQQVVTESEHILVPLSFITLAFCNKLIYSIQSGVSSLYVCFFLHPVIAFACIILTGMRESCKLGAPLPFRTACTASLTTSEM